MQLQKEDTNLFELRTLFDSLLAEFLGLDHYLGSNFGTLCHYPTFENGIVKSISGAILDPEEVSALAVFSDAAAAAEDLPESENYASQILAEKRKLTLPSLEWIPPTSNSAGRFFSTARYVHNDYRKKLAPLNFESQVFLKYNSSFWDVNTANEILRKLIRFLKSSSTINPQ